MHWTKWEERQEIIKHLGEKGFRDTNEQAYLETQPPEIPVCFSFLFNVFLSLRNTSENGITYTEIKSYCDLMETKLSKYDIELLFRMNSWAGAEINKIRENE